MKLAIITDSTCDLSVARQQELGLSVVPLSVHIGDQTYEDWVQLTPQEMFKRVERGDAPHPTTSQPSPERFRETYQAAFEAGAEEIISVHISQGLSGTIGSANLAAKEFSQPIHIFDSREASVGLGAMVIRASEMRADGADAKSIMAELERIRETIFLRFILPRLEYLQKGGRIGGAAAFVGGLLKLTPILTFKAGKVETAARARGLKKAMTILFDDFAAYVAKHPGTIRVFPVFGTEDSEMKEAVLAEFNKLGGAIKLEASTTGGSVIGVYGGPGWFGFSAYPLGDEA